MTYHYKDLGKASDWSCREENLLQPITSTTQVWEVYVISMELAFTKTLFYFSYRFFRKHRGARERKIKNYLLPHHYLLALAVSKSPAVYILSPVLD